MVPADRAWSRKPGKGIRGNVDGHDVALGNRALMEELRIDLGELPERAEVLRADGQTVMFVALDGKPRD